MSPLLSNFRLLIALSYPSVIAESFAEVSGIIKELNRIKRTIEKEGTLHFL
jgi:hypothetical protein